MSSDDPAVLDDSWSVIKTIKKSPPVDLTKPYDTASLAGKTILITGGASGFGAAFARKWASHGAHLIIGDISDAAGEELVAELRTLPGSSGHHIYQHCDVTNWADQVALFRAGVAASPTHGIDAVIVNAGTIEKVSAVTGRGFENPIDLDQDAPPPPPLTCLAVNLTGAFYTVHLALFWLQRNGGGPAADADAPSRDRHILLVSSIAGLAPLPGQPEYTASKHALLGLFRALRGSTFRQGIRVNLIAPYFVNTPLLTPRALMFTAGGGMGEIEDVVDAASRLVADESIVGRGLLIGPKMHVVDSDDGETMMVTEAAASGKQGSSRTQAVWEINAHDYERTELFVWRYVAMLNLIVKIKGWVGYFKDVYAIFTMKPKTTADQK